MFVSRFPNPVSPPPPDRHARQGGGGGGGGGGGAAAAASAGIADAFHDCEEVNLKDPLMDSPLVGVEQALVREEELEAVPAKPMRTPPQMTAAEKDMHDVTHMPPHHGCPLCASSRTPNLQHASSRQHLRTFPLLVGNYCFLRRIDDTILAACLCYEALTL